MGIAFVEKNPGISTNKWMGLMFKRTGMRIPTIERMLSEMLRFNLLEEVDGCLYPFDYFRLKKIEEEYQHVS